MDDDVVLVAVVSKQVFVKDLGVERDELTQRQRQADVQVVQIVETLFPIFGLADELVRLFVIILVIGFPLILIFSWLYELTPERRTLEQIFIELTCSEEQHTHTADTSQ